MEESSTRSRRLDEYFRDTPMFPRVEEGRGRFLVSRRLIRKGEVLLVAQPYAIACKQVQTTCAYCLRHCDNLDGSAAPMRAHCAGCKAAWYCNATEKAMDWEEGHHLECQWFKRIREYTDGNKSARVGNKQAQALSSFEEAELRLLVKCLRQRFLETMKTNQQHHEQRCFSRCHNTLRSEGGSKDGDHSSALDLRFADLQMLWSNSDSISKEDAERWTTILQHVFGTQASTNQQRMNKARRRNNHYGGSSVLSLEHHDLLELLSKDFCNGFALRNREGGAYAFGSYPSASYFNHSCNANACRIQGHIYDKRDEILPYAYACLRFVALRDIQPEEEITISYLNPTLPLEARRSYLSTLYFFKCDCELCRYQQHQQLGGKEKEEISNKSEFFYASMACGQCHGRGVLYPKPLQPSSSIIQEWRYTCNICGRET
ncbi:Histone-lysine N-trimethyltransferase SMYD5 [Balamuthia mandrillaris]